MTNWVEQLVAKTVQHPWHRGLTVSLHRKADEQTIHIGGGMLSPRTPFFLTGGSKLYITAIVLQLIEEGKIALDAPFKKYLPGCKHCIELHVIDGVDYTEEITIHQLMSHTSGLGDFFMFKNMARSVQHQLVDGIDEGWTFEEVVMRARSHGALRPPGQCRRALYSDTNFQILGMVLESIEGKPLQQIVRERITLRLGLYSTYLYCDPSDKRPMDLMSREKFVHVPRTMASFQADGGIVTTSTEALAFLRAFFEGGLFNPELLRPMMDWRGFYFPTQFGTGIMRIAVPWWMSIPHRLDRLDLIHRKVPPVYGFLGIGGTFLFYQPETGIYSAGTANQLVNPAQSLIFALRALDDMDRMPLAQDLVFEGQTGVGQPAE